MPTKRERQSTDIWDELVDALGGGSANGPGRAVIPVICLMLYSAFSDRLVGAFLLIIIGGGVLFAFIIRATHERRRKQADHLLF
jgi:hypothetical protein